MQYKYAWYDVKLLSLRNETSNVGKDTGITVKLRLGRVRHLSAWKRKSYTGIHISSVLLHYIHQAANSSGNQLLVLCSLISCDGGPWPTWLRH